MRWSCSKRLAYVVANLFAKESEKRRQSACEKPERATCANITQNCVHFPDSAKKRPSRLHTWLMHFNKVKFQVFYNQTLTNSHLPLTAGTTFESSNPCRGVPT